MADGLGDRCKAFEQIEAGRAVMPGLPILARLDGRAFHTFTRGMRRPYDEAMQRCMIETARHLVLKTHPAIAYTQSDEITLCWPGTGGDSEALFGGRYQKLTSVLAGLASCRFMQLAMESMPERAGLLPHFDCRVWEVPTQQDVADVLIWREDDATKNSITMAARAHYSDKQLFEKHSGDKHEMLHAKGINWNDYPAAFKRGTYLQRKTVQRTLAEAERQRIPEQHRPPVDAEFARTEVAVIDMPPVRRVVNLLAVIFEGAVPVERSANASAPAPVSPDA